MQAADNRQVQRAIQRALADESTTELQITARYGRSSPPLTVIDAGRIMECLQENPHRFDTFSISGYSLHDDAVLNVLRDGLPLCTSVTTVILYETHLENEDLDRLRPAFYNTSVTKLDIHYNDRIEGQRGGEVLRDLLVGNDTLRELIWWGSRHFGPEGAIGFGQGLAANPRCCLRTLSLDNCNIGNEGLTNLVTAFGETTMMNNNNATLLNLRLGWNSITGAEGGRQVTLLLQHFPSLKVLGLGGNNLGPLGASALAPGLAAAASRLEELLLHDCGLGNDGVSNLVPNGQVNKSLTSLDLRRNSVQSLVGGENVVELACRCTNLDSINVLTITLSQDQQRRLDLLLDRKRLYTAANALAGSTFPILFRAMVEAHGHEHGLSAIFVILQNDGDDYFCNVNNRAIECHGCCWCCCSR